MIKIITLSDKRIEKFLKYKDKDLKKVGLIIAESPKVLRKLLKSSINIYSILCCSEYYEKELESIIEENNTDIFVISRDLINKVTGYKHHLGVMALAQRPQDILFHNLPNKILCLNSVTSPENVGTISRTMMALGIRGLLIGQRSCSPFTKRAIRVSLGNIFRAQIHHSNSLVDDLIKLKEMDYKIIGAANESQSSVLSDNLPEKAVLIIGSEGHGITEDIRKVIDDYLKIPIDSEVAHMNAAAAAAIFLYKWVN